MMIKGVNNPMQMQTEHNSNNHEGTGRPRAEVLNVGIREGDVDKKDIMARFGPGSE